MKSAILDLYERTWNEHIKEIESFDLEKQDIDDYHTDLREMILNWLDSFMKESPKDLYPQTEVKLFSKKYKVWGKIDIIKNGYEMPLILDYKISKSMKIYDEMRLQLAIYSLLYYENMGTMNHKVGIHFLKFPDGLKLFKPTEKSMQYAIDKIGIVRAGTTSRDIDDYPCTCGGWCKKDFVFKNG